LRRRTAAIDMAVELLARHCGRARACKGLADMLVDEPRHPAHPLRSMEGDPRLGRHLSRAIALMRSTLGEPMGIPELARRIGIGRRHLDRLFQERFGVSAHEHWTRMRLEHAQWRVQHSHHSLASIAGEVGLASAASLGRLMRQHLGQSPGALRAQRAASPSP
jgi:transcriptional regulator GlxA family with amidase domain